MILRQLWRGLCEYWLWDSGDYVSSATRARVRATAEQADREQELLDARADRKRERTHATPTNRRALTSEVRP